MRAVVNLAGLSPKDVRVEAVIGRVGVSGNLEETQVMTLARSRAAGICVRVPERVRAASNGASRVLAAD